MESRILIVSILASLNMLQMLHGQDEDVPFNFQYEVIPFGSTMEEVLKTVKGAEIFEDRYTSLEAIGFYQGLSKYFPEGIYTYLGVPYFFNSSVVKKYKIRSGKWSNIKEIELFLFLNLNLINHMHYF